MRFYSKAMYRQIGEGCLIQSSEAELLMNGKLDHFAPVVGGWWSPQQCRVAGGESGILAEPELFFSSARLLTQFDTHTNIFFLFLLFREFSAENFLFHCIILCYLALLHFHFSLALLQ